MVIAKTIRASPGKLPQAREASFSDDLHEEEAMLDCCGPANKRTTLLCQKPTLWEWPLSRAKADVRSRHAPAPEQNFPMIWGEPGHHAEPPPGETDIKILAKGEPPAHGVNSGHHPCWDCRFRIDFRP